jgi:NitT/TauT family transport system substrate-binding protein
MLECCGDLANDSEAPALARRRNHDASMGSKTMKLAVPDLISNSYFPAVAAVDLGFFERQGLDVSLELISPTEDAYAALRDGEIDFVASSAHSALSAFPEWRGVKLLCAQSQGMYWFLVMRSELGAVRGDVSIVKGRSIGAAPLVGLGLRQLLVESGIDPERDGVKISPVPGSHGRHVSFGVTAAKALSDGVIDGFWANGMAAELAVRSGAGTLVLDVRRGDGPPSCFNYTMPVIATTEQLIERSPEAAEGAIRALTATQAALKADPDLATECGRRLFPGQEADLIADLIRRDLPFYDPSISQTFVAEMSAFARAVGLLKSEVAYGDVVAQQFRHQWVS